MTDSVVHALAETWLPFPLPEFKDLPPTMKEVMANAAVAQAQAQLTRQMMAGVGQAEKASAKREKYDRAVRSRTRGRR
jgi:hypothetical protein